MTIIEMKNTLERWEEEVRTCGKKTALTGKHIRDLRMLIAKAEEAEREAEGVKRLVSEYIDEAGW